MRPIFDAANKIIYWYKMNFFFFISSTIEYFICGQKYFRLKGVFNHQNERVYAVSGLESDEQGGINQNANYPS
jgi:hypothetical protein